MRVLPLVVGLLLATALVSLAPGAEANKVVDAACSMADVPPACTDRCALQSDCCPGQNVWCPEYPPE